MGRRPSPRYETVRSVFAAGLSAALVLCLSAWPEASWAQEKMVLRCGTYLVGEGALREEVLAKCGEPYSDYGDYWLYRRRNVIYRFFFDSRGTVRTVERDMRF
jgi:hypothetical protein